MEAGSKENCRRFGREERRVVAVVIVFVAVVFAVAIDVDMGEKGGSRGC